jgi:hypothetical protein
MGLSQTMTDAELNIKRRVSFLRVKYRQSLPMAGSNVKKKHGSRYGFLKIWESISFLR